MSASAPEISLITWCAPSSLPVTTTPATRLQATGRPSSSVSESIASIRSSTRWATEEGRPSQVGEATTRISASSSLACTSGQTSPSRTASLTTPGSMVRSTARTTSTSTPSFSSRSTTTPASASVLDGSGDLFRVQLSTSAFMPPRSTPEGEIQAGG